MIGVDIENKGEQRLSLWQTCRKSRMVWAKYQPTILHFKVPVTFEYLLPDDITDLEYYLWYGRSIIQNGVRVGPVLRRERIVDEFIVKLKSLLSLRIKLFEHVNRQKLI